MGKASKPQVIVITGSTGFVGSHLVRSLSTDGHHIKAFGRTTKPPKPLLDFAEYHQWDITESTDNGQHGKADVFIHTAGFVDFWGKKPDMYQANVVGTQNAIDLAGKMGAKVFICMSSASVYDPLTDKVDVKESAPYAKRYLNYYAATKAEAEQLLLENAGFDQTVIIRPHAIYGPGDRTLVPQILSRVKYQRFILPDSGNAKYSVTHVGNIVDAVRGVLDRQLKGKTIFNITDDGSIEAKQFLQEVLSRLDNRVRIVRIPYIIGLTVAYVLEGIAVMTKSSKQPLLTRNIMLQLHKNSTMDTSLARGLLGYEARYTYSEGLDDTFAWVHSLGTLKGVHAGGARSSWSGDIKIY